jgi:hypothetical protein
MVEKWLKIINKSWRKQDLLSAIEKIMKKNFVGLDIVVMENKKGYFRCRIGKLRIIFFEKDWVFYIDKVWYRWDVYK